MTPDGLYVFLSLNVVLPGRRLGMHCNSCDGKSRHVRSRSRHPWSQYTTSSMRVQIYIHAANVLFLLTQGTHIINVTASKNPDAFHSRFVGSGLGLQLGILAFCMLDWSMK